MFRPVASQSVNFFVQVKHIPYLPPKVDWEDVDQHLRLLASDEVQRIKQLKLADGHHYKSEINAGYAIVVRDGEHYAIYKGNYWKKLLGTGGFARVKLAQNIDTGEWVAIKIFMASRFGVKEANYAKKVGQLIETEKKHNSFFFTRASSKGTSEYGDDWVNEFLIDYFPGGGLQSLSDYFSRLPEIVRYDLAINLVKAIQKVHLAGIAHHDLHFGNIIYSPFLQTMNVIDFGLSRHLDMDEKADDMICVRDLAKIYFDITIPGYLGDDEEKIIAHLSRLRQMFICYGNETVTSSISGATFSNARALMIGVVNVNDVDRIKNDSVMLDELKKYSQVWLIDDRMNRPDNDYVKIQHFFAQNNIYCGQNNVYINTSGREWDWQHPLVKAAFNMNPDYHYELRDVFSGNVVAYYESVASELAHSQQQQMLNQMY